MSDDYTEVSFEFAWPQKAADLLQGMLTVGEKLAGLHYDTATDLYCDALEDGPGFEIEEAVGVLLEIFYFEVVRDDGSILRGYEVESAGVDMSVTPGEDGQVLVFIRSNKFASVEVLANYIHGVMAFFRLEGAVSFEWASTCLRPIPDSFGGGAVLVTKDSLEAMSSCRWLADKQAALKSPGGMSKDDLFRELADGLLAAEDEVLAIYEKAEQEGREGDLDIDECLSVNDIKMDAFDEALAFVRSKPMLNS